MKFYIADAFTNKLFGGNTAGIVILPEGNDFPSDHVMMKIAGELKYEQTAFIKVVGENRFNTRFFTPTMEVALCGHATIAAFHCLKEAGLICGDGICINRTLAETREIDVENQFVMMDMGQPVHLGLVKDDKELPHMYQIMGSSYTPDELPFLPHIISSGLPYIILPVRDKSELDNLKPNMKALRELSADYDVAGVHAIYINPDRRGNVTAWCRNFAPLYKIDEQAATGTANGALTYCLYLNNFIGKGSRCRIVQGEAMNRPSEIITEIDKEGTIKVGGAGRILVEGEINI